MPAVPGRTRVPGGCDSGATLCAGAHRYSVAPLSRRPFSTAVDSYARKPSFRF
jgi:hypothetical protein